MRIKVVILHHNKPENADKLFDQFAPVFDTELWDSGSPANRVPRHLTHAFPNIYWTGAWNEIMRRHSDCDVVWMPGCDIELRSRPEDYRRAMEASWPFGVWSPCITGRAHPFMLSRHYTDGQRRKVRNVEGQALACSGPLMREVRELVKGSDIGFGQDYWLCYRARRAKMRNVIDGSVNVFHPEGIGYNEQLAHDMMEKAFTREYGADFRRTIFEYDQTFEGNLDGQFESITTEERAMPITIFTIDNGWGLQEFTDIVKEFPHCKKVLMKKGVSPLLDAKGIEVIPYNPDLSGFADGNHLGLFPRLGPANFEDYRKILALGVPCVVNVSYHRDTIKHEVNGFVYGSASWAAGWLKSLIASEPLRDRVRKSLTVAAPVSAPVAPVVTATKAPLVTVITPTFRRDPKVIQHCINCLQLQTVADWEQLLCTDGDQEKSVEGLLAELNEVRVKYQFIPKSGKPGDFGNTVRLEMLKRATGKYVLFFDDDNVIHPDYLEKMIKAVESSGADFAVCRIVHFGPLNEAEAGKPPAVLTGFPVKLYHIDPLQVLVKREVMQDIGWDLDHGYVSDGVTLENLGKKYRAVEVKEVLGFHM